VGEASPVISGATRVAAVIGSPVRHSRSPQLLNAAFAAAGLDWRFVAFDVPEGRGGDAVAAMRTLGLGGLSVTMPHKQAVIASLDRLTPDAAALDAVNCIAWEGDELVGHNTDGPGLVASLVADHQVDVAERRCAVLGAGGAARSVIRALGVAGAADVVVVNRTEAKGRAAAALAGGVGRVGSAADVADATLVINATSVGMGATPAADGPLPIEAGAIGGGQVVVDLVYQPLSTPLLRLAEARGALAVDGLGMLVHQAALAVTLWTGVEPQVGAMAAAARA
jgi:shikimate dehydrogenase